MIRVIPGSTGEDKTKKLINAANEALTVAKGNIVYVDFDNSHMYNLKHHIRYINISEFPISNNDEFFGFICGAISEDNDISYIFIDGLLKLAQIKNIENAKDLMHKIKSLTDKFNVHLVCSIKSDYEELPEYIQKFVK